MDNIQKINFIKLINSYSQTLNTNDFLLGIKNIIDKIDKPTDEEKYDLFYFVFGIDYIFHFFRKIVSNKLNNHFSKNNIEEFINLWKEIIDDRINKEYYLNYMAIQFANDDIGFNRLNNDDFYNIFCSMITAYKENPYRIDKEDIASTFSSKLIALTVDYDVDIKIIDKLINKFDEFNNK